MRVHKGLLFVVALPICVSSAALTSAPPARAQSSATPKFEVASIKLGQTSGVRGEEIATPLPGPGRFSGSYTVEQLIRAAYITFANGRLATPVAIEAAPSKILQAGTSLPSELAWITSDRYIIIATAEGKPGRQVINGDMLRALLEDRFKLKTHRENREAPAYTLTVAPSGAKLKQFEEGSCIPYEPGAPVLLPDGSSITLPVDPGIVNVNIGPVGLCGTANRGWNFNDQNVYLHAFGLSLSEFARYLSRGLDHPVIDKTGIGGVFTFDLKVAMDDTVVGFSPLPPPGLPRPLPPGAEDTPVNPPGPSIFRAVQEQLGLKLEPGKAPVEYLVIDHVERPTPD